MQLVPMKTLLDSGLREHYAIPAFNVCNMESIQAVLETAAELRMPVILQAHYLECAYAGESNIVHMATEIGRNLDVQAAIHLDHGVSLEDAVRCIRGGFSSVMYDGSQYSLKENAAVLKQIVKLAHMVGVTVEGEVGTVGNTSEMGETLESVQLTDPNEAQWLVEETGVDCLAVGIGNAHGFYTEKPQLDFGRLEEIRRRVTVPLVLHGGTGLPEEQIRRAITMGIAKVNFSSALRRAYIGAVGKHLEEKPDELSMMDLFTAAKEKMKDEIRHCFALCGTKAESRANDGSI